jgi:hypothetical protein
MIKWQKVDKKGLDTLRHHYSQFEPYCHLNIVDMWSYRGGPNYWFKLGDTIAYKLNDYNDNSYYLTLLGEKSAKDTIKELSNHNKRVKKLTLKCLPEETLKALGKWDAVVSVHEDIDNHDYIFSVDQLVNFSSPQLQSKHRLYKKLVKKHPDITLRRLNIKKEAERQLLYRVYRRWVAQTNPPDWDKEFLALKRALSLKGTNLCCLGFFDGQKMIGFTVNEAEQSGYYQAFFGKADRAYPGLGILLEHETAKYMHKEYGSKHMNLQCDQGIEGLRNYKTSLGPLRHLKKYVVVIDAAKARQAKI